MTGRIAALAAATLLTFTLPVFAQGRDRDGPRDGGPDHVWARLLERFDTNRDGKITQEDFAPRGDRPHEGRMKRQRRGSGQGHAQRDGKRKLGRDGGCHGGPGMQRGRQARQGPRMCPTCRRPMGPPRGMWGRRRGGPQGRMGPGHGRMGPSKGGCCGSPHGKGGPQGRMGPGHGRMGPPHGKGGPQGRMGPGHGRMGPPHGKGGPQGRMGPGHGRMGPPHGKGGPQGRMGPGAGARDGDCGCDRDGSQKKMKKKKMKKMKRRGARGPRSSKFTVAII